MAERRLLARQKRKQQEEAEKLAKQKAAEEKKLRAKQLRQASKAKDKKQRARFSIRGGLVHCRFCNDMINEIEFDDHYVSHPTHIRERIWLGNAENSKDINIIKKCGITHILNCTREIDLPKNISKKIKSFKRISIQDKNSETILDYINESNQFIEKALAESKFNVVFVHCREGRSRSVSFLSAYLMWKEKISFLTALADIRSKRSIVLPNNKFYRELEKLSNELVIDRQDSSKKYGTPNNSFKLKKVLTTKPSTHSDNNDNDNNNNSQFGFPNGSSTDDVKIDGQPSLETQLSNLSAISPLSPENQNNSHRRQRSSSLSHIERMSPSMARNGGRNGRNARIRNGGNYGKAGRALSPVQGSPVGKKAKAANKNSPWSDIIYDDNIKPKKKKTKNGTSSKKKKSSDKDKKKKKGKKDKDKDKDLDIEEAMDASDIFKNGKKKKKSSDKKKSKNGESKKKKTNGSGSKKKKNKPVSSTD